MVVLDHIVGSRADVAERGSHNVHHVIGRLPIRRLGHETGLEELDGLPSEAGQSSVEHKRHERHYRLSVRPHRQVGSDAKVHEAAEGRRFHLAAHNHHHLFRQFYVRLEAQIASGRRLEHEAEIDVDNVAVRVDHDVAVVPIFDLKEEADEAVGGHGSDKVAPGRLELLRHLVAVFLDEVIVEAHVRLAAELVARFGVGNALDDAAAGRRGHHSVRKEIKIQAGLFEDVFEEGNHLEGEHVLPDVVAHFEDGRLPHQVLFLDGLIRRIVARQTADEPPVFELVESDAEHLEAGEERSLGGRLHGRAGIVVNVHDERLGVGRQVAARLDDNLGQLLEAGLLPLGAFGEWPDLSRDGRDAPEKVEFPLVELLGRPGQGADDRLDETLDRVVNVLVLVVPLFVGKLVGLHVPNELMGRQLGLGRQQFDVLGDVA